jgi:hypothetical protein
MREVGSLKGGPWSKSEAALATTSAQSATSLAPLGIRAPAKSKEKVVFAMALKCQPRQVALGLNERIARSKESKESPEEGAGIAEYPKN